MKKKRISVMVAWVLAGLAALAFFLPWVRPVSGERMNSPLDVANYLAMDEPTFLNNWIGLRRDEWERAWKRPTVGLSGFQLLLLDSEEGMHAEKARNWVESVFGERSTVARLVIVLPLSMLLLTASALSPRKPALNYAAAGAGFLLFFYIWARYRLNVTFDSQVLAEMEIAYGMWTTIYLMLAMAVGAGLRCLSPKGKW